jgi:hypothetical protein
MLNRYYATRLASLLAGSSYFKKSSVLAALALGACQTTFGGGYSDISPPFVDDHLVGDSWSTGLGYSKSGGQSGLPVEQQPSLTSMTKDSKWAFGAQADLASQVQSTFSSTLNASVSGVKNVSMTGVSISVPSDVRALPYTNGNPMVIKAISADGYQINFETTTNMDAKLKANLAGVLAGMGAASGDINFNSDTKTAIVAAKGTNIAAWVIRPIMVGASTPLSTQTQGSVAAFPASPYQIQFISLYPAAAAKLDNSKDRFCVVIKVTNTQIFGETLRSQYSTYCPQEHQITATPGSIFSTVSYQPTTPALAYVGFGGGSIYGYLQDNDIHLLTANFDRVSFTYDIFPGNTPVLVSASGPVEIRENTFRGDIVVANR